VYTAAQVEIDDSPQRIFEWFTNSIAYFSTQLSIELSGVFVPYYFKCNFNIFERIAQEFDIPLPEIPSKKDYKGRFFYYGEICAALYEFREQHNMSPYELCAFLYDFAPKYVGGAGSYIIQELPEPKSAYFIGGSKDDCFLTDNPEEIACWQCNPDTMAGDMIVMYLRSPVSAIDSVWRSVSVGFNDPFFYYYRCTYISRPCKIRRVSQKEFGQDPVFRELPIVKKNMQGINGVELYPSVYNHLLDLVKSDLPRFAFVENSENLSLSREKDVENQLIKPFLAQLGYSEADYRQQLYIEIGNHNHALIPDFVIHPNVSKGHQSAAYLIEAKYSIATTKLLEEAKTQARGYAKLLDAQYSVIASKEGIWITSREDDYSKNVLSFSWFALQNVDNFHMVFALLGKGKI
ncbi:MAG: hypothetical protein J6J03_00780, partial [Tyzzerella sp.]|nr:hypothetical protein [Tyzzerella sp.]